MEGIQMNENIGRKYSEEMMEGLFKEMIPHIEAIEKIMRSFAKQAGEEKTVDITVTSEGFVKVGVYGTGYELAKYHSDQRYRIRKEYSFEAIKEVS